jgi:carbamoyl-phosphate synthase large subunit
MPSSMTPKVYIIEVNPRASRTVPFISKVTGVPMVKIATRVMLGHSLVEQGYHSGLWRKQKLIGIKAPVFSMSKLAGVDTYLGPEMKSTGEVMGIDYTYNAALAKVLISAGLMLPPKGAILFSIADRDKPEALPIIRGFAEIGFRIYATEGTASLISDNNIPVTMISKKLSQGQPNIIDLIINGEIEGVVNTITGGRTVLKDGFAIRRAAAEKRLPYFTSLDTIRAVLMALTSKTMTYNIEPLPDYRNNK